MTIRSRGGRVTVNAMQEAKREEAADDGPARRTTDPWGVTSIPGINGEPKRKGKRQRPRKGGGDAA